jgi:hypothetical protein
VLGIAVGFMGLTPEVRAAEPVAVEVEGKPKAEKPKAYTGMDEKVNEAMAEKAGTKAHDPYINLEEKGDVWNTTLLAGGALAGFIIGRWWHLLFVRQKDTTDIPTHPVA